MKNTKLRYQAYKNDVIHYSFQHTLWGVNCVWIPVAVSVGYCRFVQPPIFKLKMKSCRYIMHILLLGLLNYLFYFHPCNLQRDLNLTIENVKYFMSSQSRVLQVWYNILASEIHFIFLRAQLSPPVKIARSLPSKVLHSDCKHAACMMKSYSVLKLAILS